MCFKMYILFPQSEIIPCEGNITRCGHGCLTTDKGAVCVCPEGSLLQEDGQGCTGMHYITAYYISHYTFSHLK